MVNIPRLIDALSQLVNDIFYSTVQFLFYSTI